MLVYLKDLKDLPKKLISGDKENVEDNVCTCL